MKSLFTRAFATSLVAATALLASGQVSVSDNGNAFGQGHEVTPGELQQFTQETISRHGKREVTEWYSYMNALQENGEAYTYFTGTSMWPDSNAVQIFHDDNDNPYPDHVGMFSCGQVFDPTSEHFKLIATTPPLSRFNAYTVDSLIFFYKYNNVNTGVTDTLLIQFFNNNDVSGLTWNSDQSRTSAPTYDPATNRSPDPTKEIRIELTPNENTDDFYSTSINSFSGTMAVATGLGQTSARGLTAFTISFLPGMTAAFGDTIVNDSSVTGVTKLNCFMPLIVRQGTAANPAFLADTAQDHGVFAFTPQRYPSSTSTNEWYFPYNPPGTLERQHVYSSFKLSSPNVSTKDLTKAGYGLGNAYPNPASSNDIVNIPFTLGQSESVTIEMFDLVGKSVANVSGEYAAGKHTMELSTQGLNQGIYLYTITAGDYTSTKKFTIK